MDIWLCSHMSNWNHKYLRLILELTQKTRTKNNKNKTHQTTQQVKFKNELQGRLHLVKRI